MHHSIIGHDNDDDDYHTHRACLPSGALYTMRACDLCCASLDRLDVLLRVMLAMLAFPGARRRFPAWPCSTSVRIMICRHTTSAVKPYIPTKRIAVTALADQLRDYFNKSWRYPASSKSLSIRPVASQDGSLEMHVKDGLVNIVLKVASSGGGVRLCASHGRVPLPLVALRSWDATTGTVEDEELFRAVSLGFDPPVASLNGTTVKALLKTYFHVLFKSPLRDVWADTPLRELPPRRRVSIRLVNPRTVLLMTRTLQERSHTTATLASDHWLLPPRRAVEVVIRSKKLVHLKLIHYAPKMAPERRLDVPGANEDEPRSNGDYHEHAARTPSTCRKGIQLWKAVKEVRWEVDGRTCTLSHLLRVLLEHLDPVPEDASVMDVPLDVLLKRYVAYAEDCPPLEPLFRYGGRCGGDHHCCGMMTYSCEGVPSSGQTIRLEQEESCSSVVVKTLGKHGEFRMERHAADGRGGYGAANVEYAFDTASPARHLVEDIRRAFVSTSGLRYLT